MVLGFRLSLVAFALVSACSLGVTTRAETMDRVVIDGAALGLIERDALCLIEYEYEYEGAVHAVELPAPCRFLRRGAVTEPTVHHYGERGSLALVAGPLAHPDDYSRSDSLSPSDRCSHMARGVIVREGLLSVGDLLVDPLGYCAEIAPDEKFYSGIVHANTEGDLVHRTQNPETKFRTAEVGTANHAN